MAPPAALPLAVEPPAAEPPVVEAPVPAPPVVLLAEPPAMPATPLAPSAVVDAPVGSEGLTVVGAVSPMVDAVPAASVAGGIVAVSSTVVSSFFAQAAKVTAMAAATASDFVIDIGRLSLS